MKISIKIFATIAASAAIFSCHSGDTTPTSSGGNSDSISKDNTNVVVDTSHNTTHGATSAMPVVQPEQEFINYAVPKNTKEIMWLKAGLKNGSAAVKEHSEMMLKDHNKLAGEIKTWLGKNSTITMPALATAGEVNIGDKKGNDWNRTWIDKSVTDHTEILAHLKDAKSVVKDVALNKIISNTIPVVESHLAMSKKMKESQPK